MSTAMIANLVEELKTSNDKIAKAAKLEALLTSLDASIEAKDADYDRMITAGPTSAQACPSALCPPPATQANCP